MDGGSAPYQGVHYKVEVDYTKVHRPYFVVKVHRNKVNFARCMVELHHTKVNCATCTVKLHYTKVHCAKENSPFQAAWCIVHAGVHSKKLHNP